MDDEAVSLFRSFTQETVQEEEELVFFEPKSPFFQGTLKYGGGALAGLVLCGVIYETFRWLRGKKIRHIGNPIHYKK